MNALEIAAQAARWIVEEGMDHASAKRRAARELGIAARSSALPDNALVDEQVLEYLAVFRSDTQPAELRALRELALQWMERLEAFRPYLAGAVWLGTATRWSAIILHLFCDDPKSAEIYLIDAKIPFRGGDAVGWNGKLVSTLNWDVVSLALDQRVPLQCLVYDYDDVRGALHADLHGRKIRADLRSLRALLDAEAP